MGVTNIDKGQVKKGFSCWVSFKKDLIREIQNNLGLDCFAEIFAISDSIISLECPLLFIKGETYMAILLKIAHLPVEK